MHASSGIEIAFCVGVIYARPHDGVEKTTEYPPDQVGCNDRAVVSGDRSDPVGQVGDRGVFAAACLVKGSLRGHQGVGHSY